MFQIVSWHHFEPMIHGDSHLDSVYSPLASIARRKYRTRSASVTAIKMPCKAKPVIAASLKSALSMHAHFDLDVLASEIASNQAGHAVTVWPQFDGERVRILSSHYLANGHWSQAKNIGPEANGNAYNPSIAISSGGSAVVVWEQSVGTSNHVWANHFTPLAGWGTPVRIDSDSAGRAYRPSIAIDSTGQAMAVWEQSAKNCGFACANCFSPQTGWAGTMLLPSEDGCSVYNTGVAYSQDGVALVMWTQYEAKRAVRWGISHTSRRGWSEALMLQNL